MSNEELMMTVAEVLEKKLITEEVYDETLKQIFTEIKKKAAGEHTHNADSITDGTTKSIPTKAKQEEWNKKVTTEQLNAAVNTFAGGLAWKGVFETIAARDEKLKSPKEGDFVIITKEPSFQNKNTMMIYEGESVNGWQKLDALLLPGKATQEQDGLMSKEDKKKLDGLNNYTLPVANKTALGGVKAKEGGAITIGADGVIDIDGEKVVTTAEKQKWNKASTDATQALSDAKNAQTTATQATQKATQNEAKIAEVEKKFVYMTVQEAQTIIEKYKA